MALLTTNYAEIQQDEVEALRSIYMEDFEEKEIKTGAWNVGQTMFKNMLEPIIFHLPVALSRPFTEDVLDFLLKKFFYICPK